MSSEMRECPFCGGEAERIDFGPGSGDNEGGSCVACTRCQASGPVEFGYKENFISNWNRRALLARTEAGADGADLIQWRYTNVETGEVLTPWTECDATFREKRKDAPGYQFRELFLHPQDASGDAEFSAAELESLAKCVLASVTPGGFHIPEGWNVLLDKLTAMQAKEAK